jgi:hypothetical protein
LIRKLPYSHLHAEPGKKLDYALLLLLVAFGSISLLISDKLLIAALAAVVTGIISLDRFIYYKSAFNVLMPFVLLIVIGLLSGLPNGRHDYFRDILIFSRNIVYFISGVALSKYIKKFSQFFRYFVVVAFLASLAHVGKIVLHLGAINSLQTIRTVAGFSNSVEGIILSIFVSCLLSRKFREVIGSFNFLQKLMLLFTTMSFFLYFSRTLLVVLVVVCLFLCDSVYVRKIFSQKNRRLFFIAISFGTLLTIAYFASLSLPVNSPVRTLVEKFQNVPDEVTWSKERNLTATREEIQNNWRGYEAYQGLLKFEEGGTLQRMFGFGFGARVDLGLIMKLGGKDYEDVPILHNEYVMLLVKTGIVGLLLYLLFLYMLGFRTLKQSETNNPEVYYSYQMISALSVVMLLNTFIGFGLLDPANQAIPIFIGFFWGNIQRNKTRVEINYDISADNKQVQRAKYYR